MRIFSRRHDRWELPLLGITAALAVAAVAMLFSGVHYMSGISRSAENNVVYEVMTTAPELTRLQAAIASRFLTGSTVSTDDVRLRFDIVLNRMNVLDNKASSRLRQDSPEAVTLIQQMQDAVRSIEFRIYDLSSPAEALSILKQLEPLNAKASRLSALTTSDMSKRIAAYEGKLSGIFWMLLAQILGLLMCGLVVIILLRRARQRARRLSETDTLTGLSNRLSFNQVLKTAFEQSKEAGSMAILMFDLDLFKHVNDTYGHAAGDELLRKVAMRLRPALSDAAHFARLSGDEFAAVFTGTAVGAIASLAAERLIASFDTPFDCGQLQLKASASAGVAVRTSDDLDVEDLLRKADLALYAAKEHQRGSFRLYDAALMEAYVTHQSLSSDLERAIENNELHLVFQPLVCLRSRRTESFEALMRWQHPIRGAISPTEFIPIAEETGLIREIGRWVIEEACRTAACWPESIGVAVNLSARQFSDAGLADVIIESLMKHGLTPHRLMLEITETALVQDEGAALNTLSVLREVGVRTALDDFGTGYASLSYLTRFPFDVIKIDQSFVRNSAEQPNSYAIVQTIVDLARKLGLVTVAEGIETEAQSVMARVAGCDKGQGYLFDRPLTVADCAARLALEQIDTLRHQEVPGSARPICSA